MKLSDLPSRFNIAFAASAGGGYVRTIPQGSQIGITDGAASLTDGFPPLNFLPVGAGGVPPFGQDMNGILRQTTQWSRWQGAGAQVPFDGSFATAIGGYPRNSLVSANGFTGYYVSTVDDNTGDPNAGAPNWLAFFPYAQETLKANRTYYVATTGNDANDGRTVGTPWATLQHAWDFVQGSINLNGFTVTVQLANGSYSAGLIAAGALTGGRGPASFVILGNTTTPANVSISTSTNCIWASDGATVAVRGCRLASSSVVGACLLAIRSGTIQYDTVEFSTTTNAHIYATDYGIAWANGNYSIVGNAGRHLYANVNGLIDTINSSPSTVTLVGTPAFTYFANSRISSTINIRTSVVSFSGSATGQRYLAELLGNIYTEGGGANFYPGNSAGNTLTSGIYN